MSRKLNTYLTNQKKTSFSCDAELPLSSEMSYWDITICWNLSSVCLVTENTRRKSQHWRCPHGPSRSLNFPLNLAFTGGKWLILGREIHIASTHVYQSWHIYNSEYILDNYILNGTRFQQHDEVAALVLPLLFRRMFPSVRVKVRNLDPCQQYYIAMDVMPVDSKRYRCVFKMNQTYCLGLFSILICTYLL